MITFFEGRRVPAALTRMDMGHYGDAGWDAVAATAANVSPWNFLKGVFVDKPLAEQQNQVTLAQTQSQAAAFQQQERAATMKTAMMIGAGVLGLLVVASVLRPAPRMAGYRRKRRSKRSRS